MAWAQDNTGLEADQLQNFAVFREKHQGLRLQIAVGDVQGLHVAEDRKDLLHVACGHCLCGWIRGKYAGNQGAALRSLHYDVEVATVLEVLVDLAGVGVVQEKQGRKFREKPGGSHLRNFDFRVAV